MKKPLRNTAAAPDGAYSSRNRKMPKKKVVNLAMIGCGGIAGAHLRRYQDLIHAGEERFRIVATVDTALDRAKAFARTINADTGWKSNPSKRSNSY